MLGFSQVDVFTAELLAGNPVAVVHGADGLSDERMAALARWTNLSETTFLLDPTHPDADYRLRIFTPGGELPFAGHPTLGSARAWLDAGGSARTPGALVQQCAAGLIALRTDGPRLAFLSPPLLRGGPVTEAELAPVLAALRVPASAVLDAQWADNGPGWLAVLLADAEAVLALEPDRSALGEHKIGVVGAYPAGAQGGAHVEVRAFAQSLGVGEDPVTGSLNAAIAPWLIERGVVPSSYVASQGARLRRRGRVHVERRDGQVWVGGDTVVGVTGRIAL